MYTVEVKRYDGQRSTMIWDYRRDENNMRAGTLDKSVDQIDEFRFELVNDLTKFESYLSLVEIKNIKKNKTVFRGRVLIPSESMGEDGIFSSDYTVEGAMGYLHDSYPAYNLYENYSPQQYARALIDMHNAQVEPYKQIRLGVVSFTPKPEKSEIEEYDTTKYSYTYTDKSTMQHFIDEGTQRWGGELIMRYEADGNYMDWLDPVGPQKSTELRIGKNIKSFTKSIDPTNVITRLIPLGVSEDNHVGQSVRLTIREDSRSGGKNYIDIPELIQLYGIQTGTEIFEDKYTPDTLYNAGLEKVAEIKKDFAKQQVQINLLDLYYLDYDPDDFERGAQYKTFVDGFINGEWLRIVGTNEDITMPHNKTVTIGERPLTIADVQTSAMKQVSTTIINNTVPSLIESTVPGMVDSAVGDAVEYAMEDVLDDLSRANSYNYQQSKQQLINEYNAIVAQAEADVQQAGVVFQQDLDKQKNAIKDATLKSINDNKGSISSNAINVQYGFINQLATDSLFSQKIQTYSLDAFEGNITTLRSKIITADSITSSAIKADYAMIEKLTGTQAFIDKVQTISIDFNKATARGSVNSSNYITISNDEMNQYGTYDRYDMSGLYTESLTSQVQHKNGNIRFRNIGKNRSLYFNDNGITTALTATSTFSSIKFFDVNSYGRAGIATETTGSLTFRGKDEVYLQSENRIGLNASKIDFFSYGLLSLKAEVDIQLTGQNVVLDGSNMVRSVQPIQADIQERVGSSNLYARTSGELRVTDLNGYNNANITYKDIRYAKANAVSHEKFKYDIVEWDYDVLGLFNDLQLYRYKFNSEKESGNAMYHHGIILREDSNNDRFPSEWRNGDGFDVNEVVFWNTKAIQELLKKIDELEGKINGRTT